MNQTQWLAEIGEAAEDLGYGIASISYDSIELIERQGDATIRIETRLLSGEYLRSRLVKIPHRSGSPYTQNYLDTVPR